MMSAFQRVTSRASHESTPRAASRPADALSPLLKLGYRFLSPTSKVKVSDLLAGAYAKTGYPMWNGTVLLS